MIKKLRFKRLTICLFACALLMGMSIEAEAQRRTKSKRTRKVSKAAALAAERRKGAEDVAIQIKNVTKFVFVLGGIATGIEEIDKEIEAGRATSEIRSRNQEFKDNVVRSIVALRKGLMKLEVDFRAKSGLKPYSKHIEGIFIESEKAERLASAGQLNDSGKELLLLVERLTDVLVEMP